MSWIPQPSISNPYTYMDTIKEYNSTIWNEAVGIVNGFDIVNTNNANERRNAAINFLNQMAEQWRTGERAFLNNMINKLQQAQSNLPDEELQRSIKEIQMLVSSLDNNGFNYKDFSSAISIAIKGINNYKARLNNIQTNFSQPKSDRYLLQEIDTEYESIIDILNGKAKWINNKKKSYERQVATFVYNYIEKNKEKLKAALLSDSEYAAWLLQLSINFRHFMEQEHMQQRKEFKEDYTKKRNTLKQSFNKFIDEYNDQLTCFDTKEREVLKKIASSLEFQPYKDTNKKYIKLPTLQENPTTFDIAFTSNLSVSNLDEQMGLLIINNLEGFLQMGRAGMGNDSMSTSLSLNYNFPNYDEELNAVEDTLKQITSAMEDFAKIRINKEKVQEANKTMNEKIENFMVTLDNTLKLIDPSSQAFIIHESDKYYQTMEQGYKVNGHTGTKGFHGRTIAILNYIDIMYNLSLSFGVGNPNLFKFIAYNLDTHSPAANMRDSLEEIFTYAAGMIMFDDVGVAVREATKEVQFSNITNIHLYKLQELYFPGSYLLSQTAAYLSGCPYDETNAATAEIEVGDNIFYPNYTYTGTSEEQAKEVRKKINKYSTSSAQDQWDQIRNYMISQTKVSIHFFLNFSDFVSGMR